MVNNRQKKSCAYLRFMCKILAGSPCVMVVLFLFLIETGGAYAPLAASIPLLGAQSEQESRDRTIRAALAGWAEEQFEAGTFYDEGGALTIDYEIAAFWYSQAAAQNHIQATLRLGQLYYFGLIGEIETQSNYTTPDYNRACSLFEQAAIAKNGEAMFYLGSCAIVKHKKSDWISAAHWYHEAAKLGVEQAFLPLAQLYYQGQGVTQDFIVASQWFEKAANSGDLEAAFYLGFMLDSGQGVEQDSSSARYWYAIAAEKGHREACYNLALLYEEGRGGERDFAQAFHLYQRAANLGDVDALVKLGSFYQQGLSVLRDNDKAFAYYRQAASLGDEEMQYYLGLIYSREVDGDQPAQDFAQARFWLEKAAGQGNSLAQARLNMLRRLGLGGE